jgi:hypothetical protein
VLADLPVRLLMRMQLGRTAGEREDVEREVCDDLDGRRIQANGFARSHVERIGDARPDLEHCAAKAALALVEHRCVRRPAQRIDVGARDDGLFACDTDSAGLRASGVHDHRGRERERQPSVETGARSTWLASPASAALHRRE